MGRVSFWADLFTVFFATYALYFISGGVSWANAFVIVISIVAVRASSTWDDICKRSQGASNEGRD